MPNEFLYSIERINPLTPLVSQLFLTPQSKKLPYVAGQYTSVLHHDETFSYLSIANSPTQNGNLEFHLFHPAQNRQALDLLTMAQNEKRWRLLSAMGHCTVDKLDITQPIIFIARNTGFASIKAIIENLIATQKNPRIDFYWSVPKSSDLYLQAQIENWKNIFSHFNFFPFFSREEEQKKFPEYIFNKYPDFSDSQVYVSGPQLLVREMFELFKSKNLKKERFYSDVL